MGTNDYEEEITVVEASVSMADLVAGQADLIAGNSTGVIVCKNQMSLADVEADRRETLSEMAKAIDFTVELLDMSGPLFDDYEDGFPFLAAGDLEQFPAGK